MHRSISAGVVLISCLVVPAIAKASGVGGYISGNQRQIDHSYEEGKAIYQGRAQGARKIKYCVDFDGERVPLKRKTIKQFRNVDIVKFANSLYDCANPEKLVGLSVSQSNFRYVLYYLNKRYRLKLSSDGDV